MSAGAPLGAAYLEDALRRLRGHRKLVERALAQVSDADFFRAPSPGSNSIAVLVKHLAGNMRSRFTDFLESDGEKPDRHRDREFETEGDTREALMTAWEEGWAATLDALGALKPEDLERTVRIKSEPHTVVGAVNRHLAHLAYHAGQIAYVAKLWAGPEWKTLSIPKGGSDAYFEAVRRKNEEPR